MPNPAEIVRNIHHKINPEGLGNPDGIVFNSTLGLASLSFLPLVGGGLTYTLYELSQDQNPAVMQALAIGGLGILNVASVISEVKALKSKEYSASTASSTFYALWGRPFLSSIGGHAANYFKNTFLNPVNYGALALNHPEVIIPNEVAGSIIMTAWNIGLNTLIVQGKTQPIVDWIEGARNFLGSRFRRERVAEEYNIQNG